MVKIRHTGIVTFDLKKSLLFWKKYLGFKVLKDQNEKGNLIDKIMFYKNVNVRTIKLVDDIANKIEILYFKNSPKIQKTKIKPYSNGYTHISITVKNIFKLYKFLKNKKIKFNSEPQISEDGNVIMTYCSTPEGAFLELVEEINL
jgi:catechol 2,3-dioxygenase-like lactoylglutathione lyase family enzyme